MTLQKLWAVVPVKSFSLAKQRLAPVLSPAERACLARAMLTDVLYTLGKSPCLARVLVVTEDPDAALLAREAGAVTLHAEDTDLTAALELAARYLTALECSGMLIVPADLPLIACADIELIALGHRTSRAVTLVAASNDGGTNALACSPPQALALSFGVDSFRRHQQAAREVGIDPKVLTLPRFSRDIDRPDDLRAFLAQPSATRSHAYLAASGIARRLGSGLDSLAEITCAPACRTVPEGMTP
jgi:2-phospho-L-lactate guanylyltransferase